MSAVSVLLKLANQSHMSVVVYSLLGLNAPHSLLHGESATYKEKTRKQTAREQPHMGLPSNGCVPR